MNFLTSFFAKIAAKKVAKSLDLKDGPMSENVKWYKSKGVWTGIITTLVGAYEVAKVSLAPQLGITLPEIPPVVLSILGVLGIYARVSATGKIG